MLELKEQQDRAKQEAEEAERRAEAEREVSISVQFLLALVPPHSHTHRHTHTPHTGHEVFYSIRQAHDKCTHNAFCNPSEKGQGIRAKIICTDAHVLTNNTVSRAVVTEDAGTQGERLHIWCLRRGNILVWDTRTYIKLRLWFSGH